MPKRSTCWSSRSSTARSRTGEGPSPSAGSRAGASSRGALISLLLLVTGAYFGLNVAEPYWRYVQFKDEMRQQALVAPSVPDETIRRRLESKAVELGLPEEALEIKIDRKPGQQIEIWSTYHELIELPGFVKVWRFQPKARAIL